MINELDDEVDAFSELRREYEDHVRYHRERRQEPLPFHEWLEEEVRTEGPMSSDAVILLAELGDRHD